MRVLFQRSITVPDDWAGKLWPRTWCGWPKANECLTGDCDQRLQCGGNDGKPPYSSIEIELKGAGGYDTYFVTLASGYNIGVAVRYPFPLFQPLIFFNLTICK